MHEDQPVQIVPYDPNWPTRFLEERAALAAAIGDWIVGGVHHVGSTAVPGLAAKPIIDVLVGIRPWPLDTEGRRRLETYSSAKAGIIAPLLEAGKNRRAG